MELTTTEQTRLKQIQRASKRGSSVVYVRVTCILMLSKGLSPIEVADYLGIDESTVYRFKDSYQTVGLEKFIKDNYVPYKGMLNEEQLKALKAEVSTTFYRTAKEVQHYIEKTFDVSYSINAVVKLLGRLGFVYKKTRQQSVKAAKEAQEEFVQWFEEVLEDADNEVYFTDGVHPQHNTKSENGWALKGQCFEVEANSGRKRININGALNARDVTDVSIVESDYINSQCMIELMEKLERSNPSKNIYVVCDNAAYNKSSVIQDWLSTHHRVNIRYLPSYAPNLNLIERLWKFMKKKIINSYFYPSFAEFRAAIRGFFSDIKDYTVELQSLLTLNFHIA